MSRTNERIVLSVWIFLWCGVWIALFLNPAGVEAHAEYERSEPAAESVIPTPPQAVHIWFTQELFRREGENSIEVLDPNGTQVQEGEPVIDDDDRTHLWVALRDGLGIGEYLVRWRNLSAEDGDVHEGEFSFRVDPAAPSSTPAPPAATEAIQPTSGPSATGAPATTQTPAATAGSQASTGIRCFGSTLLGLGVLAIFWRRRR